MEAGQLAVALLQPLLEKLTNACLSEILKFYNVDETVKKLYGSVLEALNLLERIDPLEEYPAQKFLIEKLLMHLYDADDILDEIEIDFMRKNVVSTSTKPVLDTILSSVVTKNGKPRKISKQQNELEEAIRKMEKYVNKNGITSIRQSCSQVATPQSCLNNFLTEAAIALRGREYETGDIILKLTFDPTGEHCPNSGVSIVGMCGIGKTECAKAIQHDGRIINRFKHRLWLSVSGVFDSQKVLQMLQEYCMRQQIACCQGTGPQQALSDGRWLIVLDDLSMVHYNDWHIFSRYLYSLEVKFLITTHNPKVAEVTGTTIYDLGHLTDEWCQEIVIDRALSRYGCSSPSAADREDIKPLARALSRKCLGLPSIATTLGLVLGSTRDPEDRTILAESDLWDLPVFHKEIAPKFRLHCLDLEPPQLRWCLAYCALFPNGYSFNKNELVQLWMGEGFVQAQVPGSSERLDHTGNYYFSSLRERSIFQCSDIESNTPASIYKMHCIFHKFSQLAASNTCFRLDEGTTTTVLNRYTRHLSFLCQKIETDFLNHTKRCVHLRTFLVLGQPQTQIDPCKFPFINCLPRLRVLKLGGTNIDKLPGLRKLKHLRYLDISRTLISKLPESLSELWRLQFLKLSQTPILQFPSKFHKLTNLLYIDWSLNDIKRLASRPSNIGELTRLCTLPLFMVHNEKGYCISELKRMRHLHGSICISNLENIRSEDDAKDAKLLEKPYLKTLELQWNNLNATAAAKDVLTCLQPHSNLKELQITNYGGDSFPDWLGNEGSFQPEKICLHNCKSCKELPSLGKFGSLKILRVHGLDSVGYVNKNFCCGTACAPGFKSLESLVLSNMPKLLEWTGLDASDMPRLKKLEIVDCPCLTSLPSLSNLTCLSETVISRCPALFSLPELPSSLTSLLITESNMVKEHCQKGHIDWPKIHHVRNVEIDFVKVATCG